MLIASDGLVDNLRPDEIVELVRKGDLLNAGRRLVDETLRRMNSPDLEPSKPDDLTVILFRPEC